MWTVLISECLPKKELCKTCKISLFQFFFLSYFCSILCPNYQIFITRMYCGKVMFSVLSVILLKGSTHVHTPLKPSPDHVGTPGPLTCSKLVHFANNPQPGPVRTCSLSSSSIYRQAGGWPSTERPNSCN